MHPLYQEWHTLTVPCYKAAKAIGSYLKSLHKACLLPYDLDFAEHRFYDMLRKAPKLSMPLGEIFCSNPSCSCKSDVLHNVPKLRQEVESIRKHQTTFICIDCLRTNGDSKRIGACCFFHA
jgi:hypothetical protein